MIKLLSVLSILWGILGVYSTNTSEWELVKNSDNIKIYTQKRPESSIPAYKGITEMSSDVAKAVATVTNVPKLVKWLYNCEKSKLLQQISDTEFYSYTVSKAPWPLSPRDNIMHYQIIQHASGKAEVVFKSVPNYLAPNPKYTRVNHFEGSWTFIPISDTRLTAYYEGYTQPNYYAPTWLIQSSLIEIPFANLKKLRELLEGLAMNQ